MNKVSFYVFLVLLYLGISKGLSPSETKNEHILNGEVLAANFQGSPLSIILLDTFQAGFLIKTYYLKIKIIRVFQTPEEKIVRTTFNYWKSIENLIGMSIFRRDNNLEESFLPLPPGALFLGYSSFGKWIFSDSGEKVWKFHKAYKNYPDLLNWGTFRPSEKFYEKMQIHKKNNEPYFGASNEFGKNGIVTKKLLSQMIDRTRDERTSIKNHLKKYYTLPENKTRASNE